MNDTPTATPFEPGSGRAVPLLGLNVPGEHDVDAWLSALGRFRDVPFMSEGRDQPPLPDDGPSLDD